MNNLNKISGQIVNSALAVHRELGAGLLEQVYKVCLQHELEKHGLDVKTEVFMPVVYDKKVIDTGYRIDLLVESELIVELKSVYSFAAVHRAQLLTYLKLANKKLGLLINFNTPLIKDGIVRVIR